MKKVIYCFIAALLFCICFGDALYCQQLKNKPATAELPKHAKKKVLSHKKADYTIEAYLCKKQIVEHSYISIYEKSSDISAIKGRYFIQDNRSYIDGIWTYGKNGNVLTVSGIFEIENSENNNFTIKPKDFKQLRITTKDLFSLDGFKFASAPVTINKISSDRYSIAIDKMDCLASGFICSMKADFSSKTLKECGFYDIDTILAKINSLEFKYRDGKRFSGEIENRYVQGGNFDDCILKNGIWETPNGDKFVGEHIFIKSPSGDAKIQFLCGELSHLSGAVKKEKLSRTGNGGYCFKRFFADGYITYIELTVPESHISEYGYWSGNDYIMNCDTAKLAFKNGDSFEGKIAVAMADGCIDITAHEGIYIYLSGDKFEGICTIDPQYGIYTSGTTTLKDGRTLKGNWLKDFKLTEKQLDDIKRQTFPSEKSDRARQLDYFNRYKETEEAATAAFKNKKYQSARKYASQGLEYIGKIHDADLETSDEALRAVISEVDRRNSLLSKYGSYFGDKVFNKELETGMTKNMVCDIFDERIYDKEIHRNGTEHWKFNSFNYSRYKDMDEKDSFGEKAVQALANILDVSLDAKNRYPATMYFSNGQLKDFEYGTSSSKLEEALSGLMLLNLLF